MTTQPNLLASIDPEITERLTANRREFIRSSALKLGALASAPLVLAMSSQQAFGAHLPQEIEDVLVFALTLEHVEDAFYRTGLGTDGLIPDQFRTVFNHIGFHEALHVEFLSEVLAAAAVPRPELDLTGGGQFPDVLSNFDTYLALSQTLEELGVAAYKGQAPNLMANDDILTAALQIHSVEARHAAIVRKINGNNSWDGAYDEPMTKEAVLAAAAPFIA